MELSKHYSPVTIEEKWYAHWIEKRYFNSVPDKRAPFTIVIPPPNVTGVLHMGHTLNETVQDILVRKARMNGFNACWVPGSDHASIATETKVVQMLKEKGIDKKQLSREKFLEYTFEWKEKYGGIIYSQIRKLGCSVDWDRVSFTMDSHYYEAVTGGFVDLFNRGLIYRGARMINWDPAAKTALSDEEVEYRELEGILYYIKYPLADENGQTTGKYITIATQRPETIMGDTAVCVNPSDERYRDLKGYFAIVPLVNRKVPILFDDYVDKEFGTGALKITPAHDINDYNLGLKHHLPIIDTLNEDGTLSEAAQVFVGMDRFEARAKTIEQLRADGLLSKEEVYRTRLGFSQRSNAVVEPRISTQWFVKIQELAQPALKEVLSGQVMIHPEERFLNTYRYWLENVKDWCISRQLWWGQRIPAWYDDSGNFVVAQNKEQAVQKYREKHPDAPSAGNHLTQDEDVLDTWFSSWLWPIEVFRGMTQPGNPDIRYYYPTSVLVTGQDIIFFWVARMIMAGMEFMNERPFSHVYFTGMVRDKQGRKMSKSLGNSPDLLDLIDRYGADAVRFGIMISSPAGNDLLFDEAALEQGRNFNNKLWNALKLVKIWEENMLAAPGENLTENHDSTEPLFAVLWFEHRLREARNQLEIQFTEFRLSEALKTIYSLIWDDFCSWYLEWVKPEFGKQMERTVYLKTLRFFEELVQILHPFMPFITEEIYHLLAAREDDLCMRQFTAIVPADKEVIAEADLLKELITEIRNAKIRFAITAPMSIYFTSGEHKGLFNILHKQVKADKIAIQPQGIEGAISLVVGNNKIFIKTEKPIETSSQKNDLRKEIDYLKGFLTQVDKKLGNEKFIKNAKPEVIALEQKKKTDAESRIKTLEESLVALSQ
jgi:valyl-tRNA synthetase